MAVTRKELLQSISEQVMDYREGDVPKRSPDVIEKWVSQFPGDAQDKILSEINHLLKHTYISRDMMISFLLNLIRNDKFCDGNPKEFWRNVNFLNIQKGGNSQREILAMFDHLLLQNFGLTISECGSQRGPYLYLDDGLFGGTRIINDLSDWIIKDAPNGCKLRIVVAVIHSLGEYYVKKRLKEIYSNENKEIDISLWRIKAVENQARYRDISDVLWPTVVPKSTLAQKYVKYLTEEEPKYKIMLRSPGSTGKNKFFSSDEVRQILEQQFLEAGLYIRSRCPNLPEAARPLGSTLLKTLGFGSTFVTFRNCPNNAPLAFWAGEPWYPLFPRSTNSHAFVKRMLESMRL